MTRPDPSIYLVVQSTIIPPSPPPPTPAKDPLSLLPGLDLGIDFDALGGAASTDTSPSETAATGRGEDVSGDEPWIEVIECKIDLLGSEASESSSPIFDAFSEAQLTSSPFRDSQQPSLLSLSLPSTSHLPQLTWSSLLWTRYRHQLSFPTSPWSNSPTSNPLPRRSSSLLNEISESLGLSLREQVRRYTLSL